jgi:tetratricopeptide (TPR) repeat protein
MELCQKSVAAWLFATLLGSLIGCAEAGASRADEGHAVDLPAQRVLGELSFPTSTAVPAAQDAFIRGMLLLHLFEYAHARAQFLQAQDLDPEMAMAYWGEAMTHNHPIWDRQDLAAGRAALGKLGGTPEARLGRTPTPREQGFVAALELLYGQGTKAERDQAYMRAMERLAAEFPGDHEVQLFYALSLFGVQAGVRDTATYMLCTAIAQGVFSENPRHPGAAHYLIHGVDDPVHAVLGLRAARALAELAPDAGHSLHMTSHIFLAVGMWSDVVAANREAVRVQNGMRRELGEPARSWGHYNYWLLYGLLQQGRTGEARQLLEAAYAEAQAHGKSPDNPLELDPDGNVIGSVVQMWARYLIETREWDADLAGWSFTSGAAFDPNLTISFVRAMQAAGGGLAGQAGQYHEQFRGLVAGLRQAVAAQAEPAPTDLLYLDRLAVMDRELAAAVEQARGELDAAIAHAREASRLEGEMPYAFGPPFVDLPSAEFLGELLQSAGKYADAAQAFETQLERGRLKARSLQGLSEALDKLDRRDEARYYRAKLERIRAVP